jgi:hypothetical protein
LRSRTRKEDVTIFDDYVTSGAEGISFAFALHVLNLLMFVVTN